MKNTEKIFFVVKGKESFSKRAKFVLEESLITGLPLIVKERNRKKKVWKILVFLTCIFGFIYQTGRLLRFYMTYPTTVTVEDSYPFFIVQPAFTVCSNNRVRRQVFCESENISCSFLEADYFCDEFPKYCINNTPTYLGVPRFQWDNDPLDNLTLERAAEVGPTEKMFFFCQKPSEYEIEKSVSSGFECRFRKFQFTNLESDPTFCYTMDSQLGDPASTDKIITNSAVISMVLNTFPEDYYYHQDNVLMFISIHDRKTLVNPYKEGLTLKGGYKYNIYVSLKREVRLPYPYKTNCTDYLKAWRKNNGTGPLNQQSCIKNCKQEKKEENENEESSNSFTFEHRDDIYEKKINTECVEECQPACLEEKYELEYEETPYLSRWCFRPQDENCVKKYIGISIFFKNFVLKTYRYQQKHRSEEFFGYVGGYMGMWLGLSLISIMDFMECLVLLVSYTFMKVKGLSRIKII